MDMTCERAVDLAVDSLMDSLSPEERDALADHLRSCPACEERSRELEAIWTDLGRIGAPEPRRTEIFPPAEPARQPAARGTRRLIRAAAAVGLLFTGAAAGYWAHGWTAGGSGGPAPSRYLFLVRGDAPDLSTPPQTLTAEYQAWARSLAVDGRLFGAEKLEDDPGRWVSATAAESRTRSDITGYFVIAATDYEHAEEIARSSPHVRRGGTFEIRRVDPLD